MTSLKSLPPEICSLICQDPVLEYHDLASICFISRAFRAEAQRLLFHHFPCLRDITRIRSWCLLLKRKPHLALDIQGLVLFLPPARPCNRQASVHLAQTLRMCVNLKALAIFCQRPTEHGDHWASSYILKDPRFQLTKFINDYFTNPDSGLERFIRSQWRLETLKLHPRCSLNILSDLTYGPHLKTLSGPLVCQNHWSLERLQLNLENSRIEWKSALLRIFPHTMWQYRLRSLAIFERKTANENRNQCHFLEIIDFVGTHLPRLKHLQIHQFLPIKELNAYWSFSSRNHKLFPRIEMLVLRPPPCLPKQAGDNPDLCAYVRLRTAYGRHKAAHMMMKILPTLTRLVFVVHGDDYEFRRDLQTGIITAEELITLDEREWALVT